MSSLQVPEDTMLPKGALSCKRLLCLLNLFVNHSVKIENSKRMSVMSQHNSDQENIHYRNGRAGESILLLILMSNSYCCRSGLEVTADVNFSGQIFYGHTYGVLLVTTARSYLVCDKEPYCRRTRNPMGSGQLAN